MTDDVIYGVLAICATLFGVGIPVVKYISSTERKQVLAEARDLKIAEIHELCEKLVEIHQHAEENGIGTVKTNELIGDLVTGLREEFRQMFDQQQSYQRDNAERFSSAMNNVASQLKVANETHKLLIEALASK